MRRRRASTSAGADPSASSPARTRPTSAILGGRAAVAARVEDVRHPAGAQAARALLAERPDDRLGQVALAGPVGAHDDVDAGAQLERGLVGERLEARAARGGSASGVRPVSRGEGLGGGGLLGRLLGGPAAPADHARRPPAHAAGEDAALGRALLARRARRRPARRGGRLAPGGPSWGRGIPERRRRAPARRPRAPPRASRSAPRSSHAAPMTASASAARTVDALGEPLGGLAAPGRGGGDERLGQRRRRWRRRRRSRGRPPPGASRRDRPRRPSG